MDLIRELNIKRLNMLKEKVDNLKDEIALLYIYERLVQLRGIKTFLEHNRVSEKRHKKIERRQNLFLDEIETYLMRA